MFEAELFQTLLGVMSRNLESHSINELCNEGGVSHACPEPHNDDDDDDDNKGVSEIVVATMDAREHRSAKGERRGRRPPAASSLIPRVNFRAS